MFRVAEVELKEKPSDKPVRVGDIGLVLASLAVAPLLAFAALWTFLILVLLGAWVLSKLGPEALNE